MNARAKKIRPLGSPRFSIRPYLCVVPTTTPEKVAHLNASAKIKGLPIAFSSLKDLVDAFLSAQENTGTSRGNAEQKYNAVAGEIEALRTNPAFQKILRDVFASHFGKDAPFSLKQVGTATEDSVFVLPKDIWDVVAIELKKNELVTDELLESATKNRFGAGPGAETGPIMAAVGMYNFFEMIRKAALTCGYEGKIVPIKDLCTCTFGYLADSGEAPVETLITECDLCLARTDLKAPFKCPPAGEIEASRYFMAKPETPDTPLKKIWTDFLPLESVRGQMASVIYETLSGRKYCPPVHHVKKLWDAPRKQTCAFSAFDVLTVDQAALDNHKATHAQRAQKRDPFTAALDVTDIVHRPDALVLAPPSTLSSAADRRLASYILYSALDSMALDSESAGKTFILLNDGSWTPEFHNVVGFVNNGMSKGYEEFDLFGTMPKLKTRSVSHRRLCGLDILTSKNHDDLRKAAAELLEFRRETYRRYVSPGNLCKDLQIFTEVPKDSIYTSFGCISASTDNLKVLQHAYGYGMIAAQEGQASFTGGGTRHAMGQERQGYLDFLGLRDGSISTPVIVKSETDEGRLPKSAFGILCGDIFHRMGLLIGGSDTTVLSPGGWGTMHEGAAWFVLNDMLPDEMRNKSFLFHSPDIRQPRTAPHQNPFWRHPATSLLGEDAAAALFRNPAALKDQRIFLSYDLPGMKKWLKTLAADHDALPLAERMEKNEFLKRSLDNHLKQAAICRLAI